MTTHRGILAGSFVVVALLASFGIAQDQGTTTTDRPAGTGPTVGDRVGRTVDSIKRGFRESAGAVREQWSNVRTSVHNMGIQTRIYGRLHWDKDLYNADIHLDAREDGVVTLTGAVPDVKSKAKALSLAQDTVGVNKVIDQLKIQPATEGTRTTPTAPATERRVPADAPASDR